MTDRFVVKLSDWRLVFRHSDYILGNNQQDKGKWWSLVLLNIHDRNAKVLLMFGGWWGMLVPLVPAV